MRSIDKNTVRILRPAVWLAGCGLAAICMIGTVAALTAAVPRIGDIVAFPPVSSDSVDAGIRLLVHRQDRFGCVLDLGVLRRSGGSLVVETAAPGDAGHFRVHWAGARTSADQANCGPDADLMVDRRDLAILALAAGGNGADARRMPMEMPMEMPMLGAIGVIGN